MKHSGKRTVQLYSYPIPGAPRRPPIVLHPIYNKSHSYTTSIVPMPCYLPVSPNPTNIFAIRAPFPFSGGVILSLYVRTHPPPPPSSQFFTFLVSLASSQPLLYANYCSASQFSFSRESQAKMRKTTTVCAFRVSRVSSRPPPQPKREIGHLQSSAPVPCPLILFHILPSHTPIPLPACTSQPAYSPSPDKFAMK